MDNSLLASLKSDSELKNALKASQTRNSAIALLKAYENSLDEKLESLNSPADVSQKMIEALHKYNEIKDSTQALIGTLAEIRRVPVAQIHDEFNLDY